VEEVLPAVQQAAAAQGIEVVATEALAGGRSEERRGFVARAVEFLRDVRAEVRKVTWPTVDELKKATLVIVIFVTILGIVIGLMDATFQFVFVKAVAKLF
jgi:preprotein translocase subunit SecE